METIANPRKKKLDFKGSQIPWLVYFWSVNFKSSPRLVYFWAVNFKGPPWLVYFRPVCSNAVGHPEWLFFFVKFCLFSGISPYRSKLFIFGLRSSKINQTFAMMPMPIFTYQDHIAFRRSWLNIVVFCFIAKEAAVRYGTKCQTTPIAILQESRLCVASWKHRHAWWNAGRFLRSFKTLKAVSTTVNRSTRRRMQGRIAAAMA